MKTLPQKPELSFKMYEMISGYWVACCIHTAAKLNLADHLVSGAKTLDEMVALTNTNKDALYRLMRALTSVGVFEELQNDSFQINDLGTTLRTDVPGSIKPWALANLGEHFPAFGELTYGVETGKIAFDHVHGMGIWEYYKQHPKRGANLMDAMAGVSGAVLKGVIDAYEFSNSKVIVDIGGGNGALMYAVLSVAPQAKGVIFDEPYVVEQTQSQMPQEFQDRCTVAGGSFFEKIPANADLYMTKWVLHDWNDDEVIHILKVCHKAMPIGAKLLIIDAVIPDDLNTPHAGKLLDINVMALCPGKERTLKEFKHVIQEAGLTFKRLINTNTEISSIIECVKM